MINWPVFYAYCFGVDNDNITNLIEVFVRQHRHLYWLMVISFSLLL